MSQPTSKTQSNSESSKSEVSRRAWLAAAGTSAVVASLSSTEASLAKTHSEPQTAPELNGNINHSVVAWCFRPMTVEALADESVRLGIKSVELVAPEHWPMLQKKGLTCAIASSHGFAKGWNHKENWDFCKEKITASVEAAAEFGVPNVITFSGMLDKIDPDEGQKNMIEGLKTVIGLAEKHDVKLCIEPLNTRVDENMKGHPGYQCDHVEFAIDVCDAIGSDHLKILYDVYHQQIMQGDVIVRLRQYKDYIAHYHTAGVPGRKELDDTQEINYPAVMKAIVETGYKGFVGHEFIPTNDDPMGGLKQAVQVCDV